MILSDKLYNVLQHLLLIVLPAFIALLLTLGDVWDLDVVKIAATLSAVGTFLGISLRISNSNYKKNEPERGTIVIAPDSDLDEPNVYLTHLPEDFANRPTVTFDVKHTS